MGLSCIFKSYTLSELTKIETSSWRCGGKRTVSVIKSVGYVTTKLVKFNNLLPCPDSNHSADCATPELAYWVLSIASVIQVPTFPLFP